MDGITCAERQRDLRDLGAMLAVQGGRPALGTPRPPRSGGHFSLPLKRRVSASPCGSRERNPAP